MTDENRARDELGAALLNAINQKRRPGWLDAQLERALLAREEEIRSSQHGEERDQ